MSSIPSVPRFPVYLFDVDGTLLDSAPDICGAMQDVLRSCGGPIVEDEVLRRYIGRGLVEVFRDLGYPTESIKTMVAAYRSHYRSRDHSGTSLIPGVAEMLSELGGRKSTATAKRTVSTRAVLERFGIDQYFDHVQGTDDFAAKPEPDVLLKCLEALGATPAECLLVGDAPADMEAGRRAGIKICAVRYGYGDPAELARWTPDYWINDPSDLLPRHGVGPG